MASITSTYNKEQNIIEVSFFTDVSGKSRDVFIKQFQDLHRKHSCDFALIDLTSVNQVQSEVQAMVDMKDVPPELFSSKFVIAVVYDPKTYPMERAVFMKNMVASKGGAILNFALTKKEAIEWLKTIQKNKKSGNENLSGE